MTLTPIYIRNFRKGLATNSSSTHSLIYRNKGEVLKDLNIFELDYYDRMDSTIAATKEAKIKYVLAGIYWNEPLVKVLAEKYPSMKQYFPLVESEMNSDRSAGKLEWKFGNHCRGSIDFRNNLEASIDYLSNVIENDDIVIVGGSDEMDFVYDTIEGHDQLADPDDTEWCHDKSVYKNGNYWVAFGGMFEEGKRYCTRGRIRFNVTKDDKLVPEWPELIDLKITDQCKFACPQCFMGSSPKGKHADLWFMKSLINEIPERVKVEFSIGGGNPLEYPEIGELLEHIHDKGHIANITIKADDIPTLIKDRKMSKMFKDYVDGIGVSVFNEEDLGLVKKLYDKFNGNNYVYGQKLFHIVVHVIPEYLGIEKSVAIVKKAKSMGYFPILFLGYKTLGRGADCKYNHFTDDELKKLFGDETWINIDTTFANRYSEYIKANFEHASTVTWNEGEFSMYVDAVEEKAYKSSYHLDNSYNMHIDWDKRDEVPFYRLKEAFTLIRKDGGFGTWDEVAKHYWDDKNETVEELEPLQDIVPITLLTEEEFHQVVEVSKGSYLDAVKYINKIHPEIGLKFSKTYCDLYIKAFTK